MYFRNSLDARQADLAGNANIRYRTRLHFIAYSQGAAAPSLREGCAT